MFLADMQEAEAGRQSIELLKSLMFFTIWLVFLLALQPNALSLRIVDCEFPMINED